MKPLQVTLQASAYLCLLLAFAGLTFGLLCLYLPVSLWLKIILFAALGLTTTFYCWRDALLASASSVSAINVRSNQLYCLQKDGRECAVRVHHSTMVSPYLIVLNVKPLEARGWHQYAVKSVIILPDSADAEALRQLRVWLRWAVLKNH